MVRVSTPHALGPDNAPQAVILGQKDVIATSGSQVGCAAARIKIGGGAEVACQVNIPLSINRNGAPFIPGTAAQSTDPCGGRRIIKRGGAHI